MVLRTMILRAIQEMMMGSLAGLNRVLPNGIDPKSSSWRSNPKFFKAAREGLTAPGALNISPAWFQQGKDVSLHICLNILSADHI
jgi:hypothetical protein